ncbi:MAG: DNA pilot protein [Microvirus sp.]|nr:MAG: DNA pilot protein [Microvirus sp.]
MALSDMFGPSTGGSVLGSVISGLFSARQAKNQMAFQDHMSSTAHQREVADLKAAGLNPILSGTGGMGASSPGGAMGQMPDLGQSFTSGYQASKVEPEKELIKTQTDLQRENINKVQAETLQANTAAEVNSATAANLRAENPNISLRGPNIQADTGLKGQHQQESEFRTKTEYWKAASEMNQSQLLKAQTFLAQSGVQLNTGQIANLFNLIATRQGDVQRAAQDARYLKDNPIGQNQQSAAGVMDLVGKALDLVNPIGKIGGAIGGAIRSLRK